MITGMRRVILTGLVTAVCMRCGTVEAAPLILNEYNAVRAAGYLNGGDAAADDDGGQAADPFFGRVAGNGGDWFELVVIAADLDIRGWQVLVRDNDGASQAALTFSNDPALASLPAGTVITVSEEVADNLFMDHGDDVVRWINLRAGPGGTGQFVTAADFETSNSNTQFEFRAADGRFVFGPAGEGVSPLSGVNNEEVFLLRTDPSALVTAGSDAYGAGIASTFGAPNVFDAGAGVQSFAALSAGTSPGDADLDGIADCADNCPGAANLDQRDSDGDNTGDACEPGGPGRPEGGCDDQHMDMFDAASLLEVEVRIRQADWDVLRMQTRNLMDVFVCGGSAWTRNDPFTYFPADVTVNGRLVSNVGVRKKGFIGSLDSTRPSLKIKFGEYDPNKRFGGLERLTLNNMRQDPSRIKTCLGYHAMIAGGAHAPRCSYAHVVLRTEAGSQDLGIYANVESVDDTFLQRQFGSAQGNLYEATGGDFRPLRTAAFEKKNNETTNDGSELEEITRILATVPDDQLVAALEPYFNLDAFYTYWALEALSGHWDSYSGGTNNNYFLYRNPADNKFYFMPWGMDDVFGNGSMMFGEGYPAPLLWARSKLTRRLYLTPQGAARYAETLGGLFDTVWNEAAWRAEIDRAQALVTPVIGDVEALVGRTREFVAGRRAKFEADFADGPPPWAEELSRGYACLKEVGNVSVDFSTTWMQIVPQMSPPGTTVSMSGSIRGAPMPPFALAFGAGGPDNAQISSGSVFRSVFFLGSKMHVIQVGPSLQDIVPGASVPLDGDFMNIFLSLTPLPSGQFKPNMEGILVGGRMDFDAEDASTVPGERIAGHLEAKVAGFSPGWGSCHGDCSGENTLTADEIVQGVHLALDLPGTPACLPVDRDENYQVTVEELVRAVGTLKTGCPQTAVFVDIPPV